MRVRIGVLCVAVGMLCLSAVVAVRADEPGFVRRLAADDPGDETIRNYWERAERGELTAVELVDLGTMVFRRDFPKDAIGIYKRALDLDPEVYEAWFRMGLAEHRLNELDNARQAYRRCLKQRPGHGWCNFYLGLLEEQLGHSSNALMYYERSFEHAPELADAKVNPAVLSSKLVLGARLHDYDQRRFEAELPLFYLQPNKVGKVYRKFEPLPTPAPEAPEIAEAPEAGASSSATTTQQPVPQPTTQPQPQKPPRSIPQRRAPTPMAPTPTGSDRPGGSSGTAAGMAPVPIGNTSDEVHLMPWWPRLSQSALVLV